MTARLPRPLAERQPPTWDGAQLRLAGRAVAGEGKLLDVTYPVTGELLHRFAAASTEQVDIAVEAARDTFDRGVWRHQPAEARAAVLERAADLLESRRDALVRTILFDNGKTRPEAEVDVMAAVAGCRGNAALARQQRDLELPDQRGIERRVSREPVGVVAAITPFNAPLMFAGIKATPALAAGNSVVLKPSERSPLVTAALVDCLREAGLPDGVLSLVHGGVEVAAHLVGHPAVDLISLTGGNRAGTAVMQAAAPTIKNLLLELGGKSAHIVLADADLERAVPAVAAGVFRNSGQRCLSGTRLVVEASVADEVIAGVVDIARGLRLGDPFEAETQVGPLIDQDAVDGCTAFLERAVSDGARVLCGGKPRSDLGKGSFFAPTVVEDRGPDGFASQEELFGPVLTVLRVADGDEAVRVANQSRYGLAGGLWTRDLTKARRLAAAIRTGYLWVNTYSAVFGDVPFGGFGRSGVGREAGIWGYEAYTELKTVMIDPSAASAPHF